MKAIRIFALVFPLVIIASVCAYAAEPTPPDQPFKGPGGRDYLHAAVSKARLGAGGESFWLYTPDEPRPSSAPVVVLLHGWGGMDPVSYGGWIEHLVRRGNIVIYPRYQADLTTPPTEMTGNALDAINSALAVLQEGEVKPQREHIALIGHSLGGVIAANLACEAASGWMPLPKAVMVVAPGDSKNSNIAHAFDIGAQVPGIMRDYGEIPQETLLLCVVCAEDFLAGSSAARNIFYGARNVPRKNKDFVTVKSDRHGSPQLVASHFAPLAPDEDYREEKRARLRDRLRDRLGKRLAVAEVMEAAPVNALDFFGFWKLADALCACAFRGELADYALGGSYDQKSMGLWSDGIPVEPLEVTDSP
jgi:acetyl esterase/lipase